MNPEQKELFHSAILKVLDANRTRFGLGVKAVALHLMPFGFTAQTNGGVEKFQGEVADGIDYLAGKALAEEVAKPLDRANRCWRITAAGIEYLDQRN